MSPERLIEFMQRLIKDAPRKVFLNLDTLNIHKAKVAHEWLDEHANRIEVFYLPPYSPELKPSEYFNDDLRGEIQRGIPPKDVTDLKRTMPSTSHRIQNSPGHVRAYCKHRNSRYVTYGYYNYAGPINAAQSRAE